MAIEQRDLLRVNAARQTPFDVLIDSERFFGRGLMVGNCGEGVAGKFALHGDVSRRETGFGSTAATMVCVDRLTNLLLAARDGDRDSLERFIAETQADVWRLCRYLGDVQQADDLAQETYERAISSIHRYRADGPAKGWLLTIARRVCVDHTRRVTRRRRLDRSVMHNATAGSLEGSLISPDPTGRIDLDDVLGDLDDDRKNAFVLTQVLGLQYDEVAEILGIPIGTVRSRVSRARNDLIEMMTDDNDQDVRRSS